MTNFLDSAAHFRERVVGVGLGDFLKKLDELQIHTMGDFCYSTNHVPGRPDDSALIADLVIPILESDTHAKKPAIRRLFVEAYGLSMEDAARRVKLPDGDEKPKKLPLAERSERIAAAKMKFNGISIENNLEPSWALIDKFVEMLEYGEVRYVPWEEYTKRNQESIGEKKVPLYGEDEDGRWKRMQNMPKTEIYVVVDSLLAAKDGLQRRGMALHIARLLNFMEHERLIAWYFAAMEREPLEDYQSVSLQQVRRCDREIWVRLGRLNQAGFGGKSWADGVFPLDQQLRDVMKEYRITALLNELPLASSSKGRENDGNQASKRAIEENARLKEEIKRLKSQPNNGNGGGNGNKGRGGGGGGRGNVNKPAPKAPSKGSARMPKELIGGTNMYKGEKICFDYNLPKSCNHKSVDACNKGVHRCCHPGCGEKHSFQSCPMRAAHLVAAKNGLGNH